MRSRASKTAAWSAALANAEANQAIRIVRPAARAPAPKAVALVAVAAPQLRRSKTEERYEELLVQEGLAPLYEPLRLRIELPTGSHRYKPDFLVRPAAGPELHEVKGGYPRERDWMRFEMAVAQWGWLFTFVWAQWVDGQWKVKRYPRIVG